MLAPRRLEDNKVINRDGLEVPWGTRSSHHGVTEEPCRQVTTQSFPFGYTKTFIHQKVLTPHHCVQKALRVGIDIPTSVWLGFGRLWISIDTPASVWLDFRRLWSNSSIPTSTVARLWRLWTVEDIQRRYHYSCWCFMLSLLSDNTRLA